MSGQTIFAYQHYILPSAFLTLHRMAEVLEEQRLSLSIPVNLVDNLLAEIKEIPSDPATGCFILDLVPEDHEAVVALLAYTTQHTGDEEFNALGVQLADAARESDDLMRNQSQYN